jgi:hypothetical protein
MFIVPVLSRFEGGRVMVDVGLGAATGASSLVAFLMTATRRDTAFLVKKAEGLGLADPASRAGAADLRVRWVCIFNPNCISPGERGEIAQLMGRGNEMNEGERQAVERRASAQPQRSSTFEALKAPSVRKLPVA